eukprot:TRINITY_DN6408_c0_g1_i1.p1 TRINITY_DN6408_c0_g1~~TRINITY_DN6408_c0_g1_i1.p1  ORF type:complete len:939 (-),score=-19.19 TRINITY_DN6408_c0_g1_i1:29-2845(-)
MKKTLGAIAVALAMSFSANAGDLPKIDVTNLQAVLPVDKDVKIGTLPNGMVYYIRKNNKPENRMHLRIVVNAGALQEDDDQNGLAHFTEHMCFNGTKHFPKNQLLDVLQKSGVRFGGDVNASTGYEQTMYELPIASNDPELVKTCFQVLQDWAHYVSFDNDEIDNERGVIVSEWRQRMSPQGRMRDVHFKKLFAGSQIEKRNVIGDTNILRHFKYDAIKRFYSDWYRTDLQAIIAVGDFDVNQIESMIKEYFGAIPKTEKPRTKEDIKVPYHKNTVISIGRDKELTQEQASVYFKLPDFEHTTLAGQREQMKRSLFNSMFRTRTAELARKPEPPFIAGSGSEGDFLADVRVFSLNATTKPGAIMKGIEAMVTEAVRVKQHGFTASELDRAKQNLLASIDKAYSEIHTRENDEFVEEYTENFLKKAPIPGLEYEVSMYKELVPKITLEEVNSLAGMYLKKDNTVITISAPEQDNASFLDEKEVLVSFNKFLETKTEPYVDLAAGKTLFNKKVTPGKVVSETKNEKVGFTEFKLSNGAKVILLPTKHKDDEIIFEAFSKGGISKIDNADMWNAGLATSIIGAAGLDEFDATSLNKVLTGKMARVSPYIGDLSEGLKGSSSKKDLETMFQLTNLYFTSPRKDGESFKSFMAKVMPQIQNKANNPEGVFADSVQAVLYNRHPREAAMTPEVLQSINPEKAFNIYKERFADAGDFTFLMVGDFDIKDVKPMFEKYIASLPATGSNEKWVDRKVEMNKKGEELRIVKGTQDRAHVRLMIPGDFAWTAKERLTIRSLIEAYDIKFTEIVREEKSGVYSPRITVSTNKYPHGTYNIIVDFVTDPARIDEMVQATKDLMEGYKKDLDEDRLQKVKKAAQKQRETSIKTNQFWAANIQAYTANGDDYNDIYKYDEYLEKLSAADIKAAANKYFNTDKMIKVILQPEKK